MVQSGMKIPDLRRTLAGFFARSVADEDDAFLRKKLEDHRGFASAMYVLGALLGSGLWVWDYVTDPVGARQTVGLRMVFLIFLLAPWLFRHVRSTRMLAVLLVVLTLMTEAAYIEILTKLKMGMVYGIGGFMYYMLLPPLAFQAFSIRTNVAFVLLSAALPHLFALAGLAPGFHHLQYAVLLWPAAMLAILIQFFYAKTYKERYDFEKRLEKMSYTDTLSGLYNRRSFMELLGREYERFERNGTPFSLLIIDIDLFKRINDTYGHPAGDAAIAQIAALIKSETREMDLAARIGGEEFAVVLPDSGPAQAAMAAERIRKAAETAEFLLPGGRRVRITLSIGTATIREGMSRSDIIKRADDAMYRAKRGGRNRVESWGRSQK